MRGVLTALSIAIRDLKTGRKEVEKHLFIEPRNNLLRIRLSSDRGVHQYFLSGCAAIEFSPTEFNNSFQAEITLGSSGWGRCSSNRMKSASYQTLAVLYRETRSFGVAFSIWSMRAESSWV